MINPLHDNNNNNNNIVNYFPIFFKHISVMSYIKRRGGYHNDVRSPDYVMYIIKYKLIGVELQINTNAAIIIQL